MNIIAPFRPIQHAVPIYLLTYKHPFVIITLTKSNFLLFGFVAYAPFSRVLLTGQINNLDQLGESDRRRDVPRFKGDNLASNLAMVNAVGDIAATKGCSAACVALRGC